METDEDTLVLHIYSLLSIYSPYLYHNSICIGSYGKYCVIVYIENNTIVITNNDLFGARKNLEVIQLSDPNAFEKMLVSVALAKNLL